MEKKIAVVVQRYGIEVNGGAEYHARTLSEHLAEKYDVTVLTTTAIDYHTWKNHYKKGLDMINDIPVYRFNTIRTSNKRKRKLLRVLEKRKKYFKILKFFKIFNLIDKKFNITKITEKDINSWISGQGPYCPDLLNFIKTNKNNYDVFIFFTYLYYPTVLGMPLVKEKSIFIPTAHDEPLLYTKPYENLFSVPKFIMYNTSSEKELVESHFEHYTKESDIGGIGIEKYNGEYVEVPFDMEKKKYFIYIGRIDSAKGCDMMIDYFINFQKLYKEYEDYKLVLIGKNFMRKVYENSSIYYTGFVNEELKYTLLKNALSMIMPSFYESLSLVTLESMIEGVPVIANKNCEVLKNHIIQSETGGLFSSQEEFNEILINYINKSNVDIDKETIKARHYVEENYEWKTILTKFDKAIQFLCNCK